MNHGKCYTVWVPTAQLTMFSAVHGAVREFRLFAKSKAGAIMLAKNIADRDGSRNSLHFARATVR